MWMSFRWRSRGKGRGMNVARTRIGAETRIDWGQFCGAINPDGAARTLRVHKKLTGSGRPWSRNACANLQRKHAWQCQTNQPRSSEIPKTTLWSGAPAEDLQQIGAK